MSGKEAKRLKRRGISLATVMFSILLLAVDLTALRYLPWPALDFKPLHLTLSFLPIRSPPGKDHRMGEVVAACRSPEHTYWSLATEFVSGAERGRR